MGVIRSRTPRPRRPTPDPVSGPVVVGSTTVNSGSLGDGDGDPSLVFWNRESTPRGLVFRLPRAGRSITRQDRV